MISFQEYQTLFPIINNIETQLVDAEVRFDRNPCKRTATKFSNLKHTLKIEVVKALKEYRATDEYVVDVIENEKQLMIELNNIVKGI